MKKFQVFLATLALLLVSPSALAGVQFFNSSNVNLGLASKVACSTGLTCTASGGKVTVSSSPSLSADLTIGGTTPYITIGDADAEDAGVVFDGNAVDFNLSLDDSADKLVIGLGSAAGTTNRMAFNSADLNIVLGDASAADMSLVFDGNAQDYHIGLDDSTDDLVIGLGSASGTTDAIRIDENQDVTFVQNVLGLGTDSISGFLQKQVAATTTSLTAVQCGSTFINSGASHIATLPEASTVLGCRYTFVCGDANDFDINPADGTDQILSVSTTNGTTGVVTLAPAAGDAIRCTDAGGSITLEAIGADAWAQVAGGNGIWTDVN